LPTLTGVLDELIETHVVDTGDVAQVTGATTRSVSRWAHAKAAPRRDELDWHKPLDLVAEGEYRRVIGAILAVAEGVTA
jgi:hypothetical protein